MATRSLIQPSGFTIDDLRRKSERTVELLVALLVILMLLVFTYETMFVKPYLGMNLNARTGEIWVVFNPEAFSPAVQPGDVITSVDGKDYPEFASFSFFGPHLFSKAEIGITYDLTINRGGNTFNTILTVPGPNPSSIWNRLITESWWWGYPFLFAGIAAILLVRPRSPRQRLLIAYMFLNAIWLSAGGLSGWRIGASSLVLHAAFWLGAPITMHLHWIFPQNLGKIPLLIKFCYILAPLMLILDLLQWIPPESYLIAGLVSVFSILIFLTAQFILRRESRGDIAFLLGACLLTGLPSIILGITGLITDDQTISFSLLAILTILPIVYFLVLYRNQDHGLELRSNQIVTVTLFYILLVLFISLVVLILIPILHHSPSEVWYLVLVLTIIACTVLALHIFHPFEVFVQRRILGIPIPPDKLITTYAERITTTLELEALQQVIHQEILPSLFIRQSVLLRFQADNTAEILFNFGVEIINDLCLVDSNKFLSLAGRYLPPGVTNSLGPQCNWIRLILPLTTREQPFGVWLLGRQDPDDYYYPAFIDQLQTIANQTAIAITNIDHADKLHTLLQANIDRHENERQKLSHELHDDILNRLTAAMINPDVKDPDVNYQIAINGVTQRIRKMIHALRPAMLTYGLAIALEELFDEIENEVNGKMQLSLELSADPVRYDPQAELHIFRILQQACFNALRHAQATQLSMKGFIRASRLEITICDNGIGFPKEFRQDLNWLLQHNHFGLVGMYERADLIGAEICIRSEPEKGTEIMICWEPAESTPADVQAM